MNKIKSLLLSMFLFLSLGLSAQNYWGYANLATCNKNTGIRYNQGTAQGVAFKITKEKAALLKGHQVTGLRALFATSTGASNVKIFIAKSLGGANEVEAAVSSISPRFTNYNFSAPYTITGDSELYFGFTLDYSGTGANIFAVDKTAELPAGLVWGFTGEKWENVKSNGAPAVDLILDKMPDVTDVMVKPIDFEPLYTAGKAYDFSGQLMNVGSKAVDAVDITVTVGSSAPFVKQLTGISLAPGSVYDFKIENYTIENSGNLPIKIEATAVNGAADADMSDNAAINTKYIYSPGFKKRILIETFTGISCLNCPAGSANVASMMAEEPDQYIVVAHHTYGNPYGADLFSMTEDNDYKWFFNSPSQYAPGGMANRVPKNTTVDNPVIVLNDAGELKRAVAAAKELPPYVDINLTTSYNKATRIMTANVEITTLETPPYEVNTINVHLVQNGYEGIPQSGASGAYIHNNVFRGSLTGTWGQKVELKAGETINLVYRDTITADSAYSTAAHPKYLLPVVPEKMRVVAFVGALGSKQTDCPVYNVVEAPYAEETPDVIPQEVPEILTATQAHKVLAGESLPMAYTGKGVVVGVIDTGFDYTHPNFYNEEGTTLRIKRVWEQGTETSTIEGSARPFAFDYGMEFDTEQEILAAGTDLTGNSHGTHVAGLAAGADSRNGNLCYGVAKDADIVIVSIGKADRTDKNISDAVKYIYDYAESVGKPCVINMSLGHHNGAHDGNSDFDRTTDALQGKGRLLVGSVGNFGAQKLHASTSGKRVLKTAMDFVNAPSNSNTGAEVYVWGEKDKSFAVSVNITNKSTGEVISESQSTAVVGEGELVIYTPDSPTRGTITIDAHRDGNTGKPTARITSNITSIRSNYVVGITVEPLDDGTVHLWADASKTMLGSKGIEGWTDGDTNYTLAEIGGTGKRIISVGAYVISNNRNQMFPNDEIGGIASFSSRGMTADGRMKPEITAPGTYIPSSFSSYYTAATGSVANSVVWNDKNYSYGYMEGTSMAAPIVAGIVATWLQAYPQMTPEELRSILESTSMTDEYTAGKIADKDTWGYGKINAYDGIKKAIALAETAGIDDVTITDAQSKVLRVEYFDLSGRQVLPTNSSAIYVRKTVYADGRVESRLVK